MPIWTPQPHSKTQKNLHIYEETTSALLVDQLKHNLTDAQAHIASNVCNIWAPIMYLVY